MYFQWIQGTLISSPKKLLCILNLWTKTDFELPARLQEVYGSGSCPKSLAFRARVLVKSVGFTAG